MPFVGTAAGAACVFFIKDKIPQLLQKTLMGFAAGVMVAASVWSLLIPSMEMTGRDGFMRIFPAIIGFIFGIGFLLFLDVIIPHDHIDGNNSEGPKSGLSKTGKLVLAVALHNIPEGMAVGVALTAALEQSTFMPIAGALTLSLGLAIQNFPEGAIVAMPIRALGNSRRKSFGIGALSGLVEPISAVITMYLASYVLPTMPYMLGFAAGAMFYVVVEELIPETQHGGHSNLGTIGFAFGFILMLILDAVLG